MLLICGLGFYSLVMAGSETSYASAMAKTPWFAGATRKGLKRQARRQSSGMISETLLAMGPVTDVSNHIGAGINATDPDEERNPPPEPTPVTFPTYQACNVTIWGDTEAPPDYYALFARLSRPADISQDHVDALNIEICPPCSADQLLPLAPNGTSYLPPLVPQQAINAASYADATKADSSISRRRKDFDERLTELRIENETAYRTLTRSLKKGTKGPRLAYMRKFWEGLESMSEYWDCSKDEYREVSAIGEDGEKSAKRQRLDSVQESQAATSRSGDDVAMESTSVDFDSDATSATVTATSDPDAALLRYRGWRTGTGRAMPDTFRINTVRAFVEGTVWPFQCCVTPPRRMPTVEFGKLRLPVRQTAAVYCLPNDRMKARQGHLEGPMFAIQVRSDTDFTDQVAWPLEAHSRLDLMRELGGLLQIAQERRREGHTEVKPGEGKWWTMKPRWGGGPGGEMEKDEGNADVAPAPEEVLGSGKEQKRRKDKGSSQARARKTPAELWKELKCGNSTWDPVCAKSQLI